MAADRTTKVVRCCRWKGDDVAKALMIAFSVVVIDKLADHPAEVAFAHRYDVPQELHLS